MPTTRLEQRPEPSDATAARRKLPIGIQTFSKIREEGCYYAAKYRGSGRPIHRISVEFSKETPQPRRLRGGARRRGGAMTGSCEPMRSVEVGYNWSQPSWLPRGNMRDMEANWIPDWMWPEAPMPAGSPVRHGP